MRLLPSYTSRVCAFLLSVLLGGCSVGPDYVRPDIDIGVNFLQAPEQTAQHGLWQPVSLTQLPIDRQWWRAFKDAELDRLIETLNESNPTLQQAQARYRQAQANLAQTRSSLFPQLDLSSGAQRSGSQAGVDKNLNLSASVSWELDLWGRVRRQLESDSASMQASEADLAAIELSLQSTLAQTYLRYRALQATERLLEQTVDAYERSLEINEHRLQAGYSAFSDVAAARSQLESARTSLLSQARHKALLFHSMATLTGQAPANFALQAGAAWPEQPAIAASLPSALLLQRPDVAAAERRVAQANAAIGVAQAAWLPSFSFSANGGYRASQFADWLSAPARFWSLGPALALSLFDAGARTARVEAAQAGYDIQAGAYREQVLTAIKEVEDALAELQGLAHEQISNERSLQAGRESLALTRNQFEAGLVDYLSLAQVQTNLLGLERAALDLASERMQAAVRLLVALGGGWQLDAIETAS